MAVEVLQESGVNGKRHVDPPCCLRRIECGRARRTAPSHAAGMRWMRPTALRPGSRSRILGVGIGHDVAGLVACSLCAADCRQRVACYAKVVHDEETSKESPRIARIRSSDRCAGASRSDSDLII